MTSHILSHNNKRLARVVVLLGLFSVGCATNRETGTAIGAGGGAVAGAALGSAVRAPVAGAVVGGLVGAVAGNAIGGEKDRQQAEARNVAQQSRGLEDVVLMTQQGTNDQIIANQIRTSGVIYNLTGSHITYLKQNHVSDYVISEMQATAWRPRRVYVEPPPPAVGVGIGFRGRY